MRKMTDLPQEERLKSDQLQSLTECEQAIYAIAKKTGKSPLDIWRAQEQELSDRVSNVGLRRAFPQPVLRVGALVLIIVHMYRGICMFADDGWEQQLLGWLAAWIALVASFISLDQPRWSEWIAKHMWALANVLFSIFLVIVGFLPSSGMGVSPKLLLKSWGFALAWILIGAIFNSGFTSNWRQYREERKKARENLSVLRATFPLVAGQCAKSSMLRRDGSSCPSRSRLRVVVDWD